MKRLVEFILVVVLISWITPPLFAGDKPIEYIMITSEAIEGPALALEEGIRNVIGDVKGEKIDYRSKEAKKWIERLGIEFVPYVTFNKQIETNDKFLELARDGIIGRKNGEYIIPEDVVMPGGVMFFNRERTPDRIDLFLMSYCPHGNDAMRQLSGYLEKQPDAFDVHCRYMTIFRDYGIDSRYGPGGIREDIRQIVIQKYYPDQFRQYQKLFREGKATNEAFQALGIDADSVSTHVNEGLTLLGKDFDLTRELKITSSPTFLYENQIMLVGMDSFSRYLPSLRAAGKENTGDTGGMEEQLTRRE